MPQLCAVVAHLILLGSQDLITAAIPYVMRAKVNQGRDALQANAARILGLPSRSDPAVAEMAKRFAVRKIYLNDLAPATA